MTSGRFGRSRWSKVARNGCAGGQTPAKDNTPPFSSRRARDCTAGVSRTRSNNSLVAETWESCAKRLENRTLRRQRQGRPLKDWITRLQRFATAPQARAGARLLGFENRERDFDAAADPEFPVAVRAVHYRASVEREFDVLLGNRVAKARFNRVVVFPEFDRIVD